jgi:ABC-type multidrug transport system fused ATPase/permease subunit
MWNFSSELRNTVTDYGSAREGLDEILQPLGVVSKPDAKKLIVKRGGITLDNIGFAYEKEDVLQRMSLIFQSGQRVGLVGKSGAGKSTLVALLLRQYDPQHGEIAIDGQNITDVTLESLRNAISYVPQDTSLFHRSLYENIRYAKPDALEQEVIAAAKAAHAHEFITSLEKGYDTLVGERGVKLSGGQRQRIAIARAFLKNAPILILDEATSSLDSESEMAIQKSLQTLMSGKTVIAIAHRLSTLREMDRIVVLEQGHIVEDGTPVELLRMKRGVFKSLWDHQVSGFIPEEA